MRLSDEELHAWLRDEPDRDTGLALTELLRQRRLERAVESARRGFTGRAPVEEALREIRALDEEDGDANT